MRLFILAGEASGDMLGADVVKALKQRVPLELYGIGGEKLQAEGLNSLFPMQELSLIGFTAVITKLPSLLRRVSETTHEILKTKPDVVLLIDAQDFSDKVARKVKAANPSLKIIKYCAPTVWAWREGRAAKIKPYYDKILALFPFEPAIFKRLKGNDCVYVGHPLVEKLAAFQPQKKSLAVVLPGSRRAEIEYLLPLFMEAIQTLPHENWVMPVVPHLKEKIVTLMEAYPIKPQIILNEQEKYEAFTKSKFALCASGTVTLELALLNVPHLACYKGGWLEAKIIKKLVKIPSILLPNIILGEKIVPELLQEQVTVTQILNHINLLNQEEQLAGFAKVKALMHTKTQAAQLAADEIMKEL